MSKSTKVAIEITVPVTETEIYESILELLPLTDRAENMSLAIVLLDLFGTLWNGYDEDNPRVSVAVSEDMIKEVRAVVNKYEDILYAKDKP